MENRISTNKQIFSNNFFMLKLIWKASASFIPFLLFISVIRGINTFFMTTYLYQYVINSLQNGERIKSVIITVCEMFAFMLLYIFLLQFRRLYIEIQSCKIEKFIQNKLQQKVLDIEISCYENPDFYNIYMRALSETSDRAIKVVNDVCEIISTFVTVVSIGTLIASIDIVFVLLACVPLISTLCLGRKKNTLKYKLDMENKEVSREKEYVRRVFYMSDYAKEMRLSKIYTIMFKRMIESVSRLKIIARKYGYKLMWFECFFALLFDVVVYTGSIIIAVYKTLVQYILPLGDCFIVINSITNISYLINSIGDQVMAFDDNSRYIGNLRTLLEYKEKIPKNTNGLCTEKHNSLELKNISFLYDGQTNYALKNVSMTINSGEKVAIVGYNGSGKTTLVKLLLRFYDPIDGVITYNGHNINEYCLSSYRSIFGTVFQDFRLFSVSIAENIMLDGNLTNIQKQNVQNALLKTGMFDKVKNLPKGIDTIVSKEFDSDGVVFSGGEAQKIAIARVIARNPEIVIIDEPSSALDPIAEKEIYQNIFEACRGKSIVFITHRLSSVTMADKIYMFDNGEIIEQGTHKQLLEKQGAYAELWQKQAEKYIRRDETIFEDER